MADNSKNDKKVDAAAQGADEAAKKLESAESPENGSAPETDVEEQEPVQSWEEKLYNALYDLTDAVDDMREEIKALKAQSVGQVDEQKPKQEEVKVKSKTKYVVAKGKSFRDKATGNMVKEGEVLDKYDPERLQFLLNKGIIQEKD